MLPRYGTASYEMSRTCDWGQSGPIRANQAQSSAFSARQELIPATCAMLSPTSYFLRYTFYFLLCTAHREDPRIATAVDGEAQLRPCRLFDRG